jgi:HlyD family secretion protein
MYAGTLETTKVVLSSRLESDIVSFPVAEGTPVKKGDLILRLNDEQFKIAAKQIDSEYKRRLTLKKANAISQSDTEKIARTKEENDLKIKWCEIKSPINGIIISKFKEEGESLMPGSNIVSISNPRDIWAYFYVPYNMVHKLKIGGKVNGVLQETPGQTFHGTILKINEESEFTPKNVQTREERTSLVY